MSLLEAGIGSLLSRNTVRSLATARGSSLDVSAPE
jgi:hypothetical protein